MGKGSDAGHHGLSRYITLLLTLVNDCKRMSPSVRKHGSAEACAEKLQQESRGIKKNQKNHKTTKPTKKNPQVGRKIIFEFQKMDYFRFLLFYFSKCDIVSRK